jgi:CheY-like chemotaxis protein
MSKIFIIEDNPVHRVLMCHVIEDLGHTPADFFDIEPAKKELEKEKPALFIIDINLNGSNKSSYNFIRELHANPIYKNIPIIIVSAFASKENVPQELPFFDTEYVLEKPFNPDSISAKVKALMKSKK